MNAQPDLEQALRVALADGLPRQRHKLARFMLDNLVGVAFLSAEEMGERTGVSTSTVVRFARQLGFAGYRQLQKAARSVTPKLLTAAEKTQRYLEAEEVSTDSYNAIEVIKQDIRNLEELASLNAELAFDQAIKRICSASVVFVAGFGRARYVAESLAHQLSLLGINAEAAHGEVALMMARVQQLSTSDVLIVCSVWRYLRSALFILDGIRNEDSSPYKIALTDSQASPLVTRADLPLLAATYSKHLTHSLSSFQAMADILASGVAANDPERTLQSLKRVDAAYRELQLIASTAHDHRT